MGTLHQLSGDLYKRWRRSLERLSATGLSPLRGESSLLAKRGLPDSEVARESLTSGVRLDNNQVVWLKDDAPRQSLEDGYRGIEVLDAMPAADRAAIAATSALESKPVGSELTTLDLYVYLVGAELPEESNATENQERGADLGLWLRAWASALKDASQSEGLLAGIKNGDSYKVIKHLPTLTHAEAVLRHFRPDYDRLDRAEKAALLKGVCERLDAFHAALDGLVAFAEYGRYDPKKGKLQKLKSSTKTLQRNVRAALMSDVEGLKHEEVGKCLGGWVRPDEETWKIKRDASTPRAWVERGRGLLQAAWGEEGWAARVTEKKAQRQRWRCLSERERLLEATAEVIAANADLSVSETLQIIELGVPDEAKDGASYVFEAFNRGVEKLIEK